jgi:hypothetical protein
MKEIMLLIAIFSFSKAVAQKTPCSGNPLYRQFDFWVGEWDAYALNGKKAGDSRITLILDSCIILEEWTSTAATKGLTYSGKSFNTYNATTNQWQQTWVDNVGGSTEYLEGKLDNNKMIFRTRPFAFSKDTMAIRKLTFFNLGLDRVRQLGEISKNNGSTWTTEYDLEYRRKVN